MEAYCHEVDFLLIKLYMLGKELLKILRKIRYNMKYRTIAL